MQQFEFVKPKKVSDKKSVNKKFCRIINMHFWAKLKEIILKINAKSTLYVVKCKQV